MNWIKANWFNIALALAVFILYLFLFGDYFQVRGYYGDNPKVGLYALSATVITAYLWRRFVDKK